MRTLRGMIAEADAKRAGREASTAKDTKTLTPQSVNVTTKSGAATTTPISTGIKNGMATGMTAALLGSTPIGRVALGVGGALAGAASAAASAFGKGTRQTETGGSTGKSGKSRETSFMFNDPYAGKSDAEIFQMITQKTPSISTSFPKLDSSIQAPVILEDQSYAGTEPKNDPWVTGVDDYGETDFSVQLHRAMDAGVSASEVQKILNARTEKAERNGYSEYAYDDLYWSAVKYIEDAALNYDHSDEVRKMYAAQMESALAGLKGAYDSSMAEYDAALELLPQRYQGYRNDAAAQSAMAQKNFDERAAASGLNSGASGQAALDASAVYRGTLGQLNQAQANGLAELDRDKANLTARYETAVAQARANGDADLAQALYQELIRGDALRREDEQTAYNREQDDKKWEYTYQQDQKIDALNSATILAGQGRFEALGDYYGWNDETVQYMTEQYWTAKNDEAKKEAQYQADNMISEGIMPPAELLARAGYDEFYAKVMSDTNAKLLAANLAGSSGGTYRSSGGPTNDTPTYIDMESIYQLALQQGGSDPLGWIGLNYKTLGIPYSEIDAAKEGYQNWLKGVLTQAAKQYTQPYLQAMKDGLQGVQDVLTGKKAATMISNQTKEDSIHVPTIGWVDFAELEELVNSGYVLESYDEKTGHYSYTANPKKK